MLSAEALKRGEVEKVKLGRGSSLHIYWEVMADDPKVHIGHSFSGYFIIEGGHPASKTRFSNYEDMLKLYNQILRDNALEIAKQALGLTDGDE